MSHFATTKLKLTDKECVIKALKCLGVKDHELEIHEQPVKLRDYHKNDTNLKAHIVIRQEHFGGLSNDFGILIAGENSEINLDAFSASKPSNMFRDDEGAKVNAEQWVTNIKKQYQAAVIEKDCAKQRKKTYRVKHEGQIKIFVNA